METPAVGRRSWPLDSSSGVQHLEYHVPYEHKVHYSWFSQSATLCRVRNVLVRGNLLAPCHVVGHTCLICPCHEASEATRRAPRSSFRCPTAVMRCDMPFAPRLPAGGKLGSPHRNFGALTFWTGPRASCFFQLQRATPHTDGPETPSHRSQLT